MRALNVFVLGLALSIPGLSTPILAQNQTTDQPHHKWLDCDLSWIFTPETVGPTFSVMISFRDSLIAGAQLTLEGNGKTVATARTDSDGIARFEKIPPGEYWAHSPNGLLFPSVQFEVRADHPLGERVNLAWPVIATPVAYRFLTGRFSIAEDENAPDIPLRSAAVELRDVYTGKLIEAVSTDVNGDYEFSTKKSGLYALRLTLPKKGEVGSDNRELPIELDPSAKQFSISEMKVVQSHCAGIQLFRRARGNGGWEPQ